MVKSALSFIKIEHTIFSLPLVFTGAWFGGECSVPNLTKTILIVFAALGARIFGISFNRILDRNIDRVNPRTSMRELPSEKISLRNALFIAFFGLFFYLLSCAALGQMCLWLSPIPLIPLYFYSLLKRFTFLCHFGIGLCLALSPLAAFTAVSGHLKFTLPVITFSVFVFCWLSGADIIYAIMDLESDRINGIHSLPAKFGMFIAQMIAFFLHIMALIVMGVTIWLVGGSVLSWVFLFITFILFSTMYSPSIPLKFRFFPLSSLAGVAGAIAPILS